MMSKAQYRKFSTPDLQYSEKSLVEKKTARDYQLISKKIIEIK